MKKIFRLVFNIFILYILSESKEINPLEFREFANGSERILETYNSYKKTFDEKRRKYYDSSSMTLENKKNTFLVFAESNVIIPNMDGVGGGNVVEIKTNVGDLNAFVQKLYNAANFSYFSNNYEMGTYMIVDLFQLLLLEVDNPGRAELFRGVSENSAIGFSSGYALFAAYFKTNRYDFNLGFLLRQIPLTSMDSLGNIGEIFYLQKKSDGTYTGSKFNNELFVDVKRDNIRFNSLFSLHDGFVFFDFENSQQALGIGFDFFASFSKFKKRVQLGSRLNKSFFEDISTRIEFANDFRESKGSIIGYFYHAEINNEFTFLKLSSHSLQMFKNYDFYIKMDHSFSFSTDIFEQLVFGQSAGISIEDLLGLFSIRIGGGYNEYQSISVLPIKNSLILDLKFQVAW